MTNADKIRAMTDEELCVLLSKFPCPPDRHGVDAYGMHYTECPLNVHTCKECLMNWLKQEVEGNG